MKADKIIGAVQGVTKKWAKQRKREERDAAAVMNRRHVMTHHRATSIRDAAFAIMEHAYLKASANGRLPA
jgi:CBS-domain-containing membrane protein